MIFIAHRGNTAGPSTQENNPSYILTALAMGFNVEIDVWFVDGKFVLGHDSPQYEIQKSFLVNPYFWHHAKNIDALFQLNRLHPNYLINCFFHDSDECVITSGGWLWTYPGKQLTTDSIAVMPERIKEQYNLSQAYGICSDYVIEYSNNLNFKLS